MILKFVSYYFRYIINGTDISFCNISSDKKLYGNISVYHLLHKNSTALKLFIRFDKIDGFFIIPDGKIKHLILFDYGLFN